jgi:DNA-binding NarL/FixJ family response regulator
MNGASPIRVLLVDDHTLFRKGIANLLRPDLGFEVVGEASNGQEGLEKARELMPDVILMDISMPNGDGLEATRRIKQVIPYVRIVILTVSDEDQKLFEAIRSGAQGYLLKRIEPKALFDTIRGAIQGEAPISRTMATKLLAEFARQSGRTTRPEPPHAALTERENEVLGLIALGRTNKEIAVALAIAENTVKNHLKNILEKLHLENRVQAATYALREGLVTGSPK